MQRNWKRETKTEIVGFMQGKPTLPLVKYHCRVDDLPRLRELVRGRTNLPHRFGME